MHFQDHFCQYQTYKMFNIISLIYTTVLLRWIENWTDRIQVICSTLMDEKGKRNSLAHGSDRNISDSLLRLRRVGRRTCCRKMKNGYRDNNSIKYDSLQRNWLKLAIPCVEISIQCIVNDVLIKSVEIRSTALCKQQQLKSISSHSCHTV